MHCIDDPIELQGNYDSKTARTFITAFEMCDRTTRATCKSEEEIEEWLKSTYIITMENEWIFS